MNRGYIEKEKNKMGLDMYFEKSKTTKDKVGFGRTVYVTEGGYFRKFNALHNWIVTNIANGVDDCQSIEIEKEQLKELLVILEKVNSHHELCAELLPTKSGFFFGSLKYDDWYFENIVEAIGVVKELIEWLESENGCYTEEKQWTYRNVFYESSW